MSTTRLRLLLARVLLVSFLLTSIVIWAKPASAQTVFHSYTTGTQVFNLSSTSTTNVNLKFYKGDGSLADTVGQDTLQPNQSKTYFPISSLTSLDFAGSLVVESLNGNVVTLANIIARPDLAAGSFMGQTTGATTVRLPLLNKDNSGYYTWFSVQNVGSGGDATVTAQYSDGTSHTKTIPYRASKPFFQMVEDHNSEVFSAKITSTKPIVATVIQENLRTIFAYTGFSDPGSPRPVFPLINTNNSGYVTGIQIQNNGSSSSSVTVTYTPSAAGSACTETQTIPANRSRTFALAAFDSNSAPPSGGSTNCVSGQKFIGSARVTGNTANVNLTAVVNQINGASNKGGAYAAFGADDASSKVVLPIIMDRNGNYYTGFNIQRVDTNWPQFVNVNCTFSGTSYTVSASLASFQAMTDIQNGKISSGYVGSAVCEASSSSARLVGSVNQIGPSTSKDQLLVYETINVNP